MTEPPSAASPPRYDTITIILHWLVALLVAMLWIGGETLDWLPAGALRADARSSHILLGFVLGGIGAVRFIWRLSFGRVLPPLGDGALGLAASIAHKALYALLAAMVFVGMLLLAATSDSAFNHFNIPANDPADAALGGRLQAVHALIGWGIVLATALHILGVLFHQVVLRDGVLARMLPRRR